MPRRKLKANSFYSKWDKSPSNFSIAPPAPKTTEKYFKDDKDEMELFRQWKILIEDVEITNHTEKTLSPFIKFTIGGNYYVRSKPCDRFLDRD